MGVVECNATSIQCAGGLVHAIDGVEASSHEAEAVRKLG